jgi:hypothetical protein
LINWSAQWLNSKLHEEVFAKTGVDENTNSCFVKNNQKDKIYTKLE